MQQTISALVENRPGVLADMANAFGSHGVNIKSISCGETDDPGVSRMVISVEATRTQIKDVTSAMKDMDFVLHLDDLARKDFVDRELVMMKVVMDPDSTPQLMQIAEVFRAHVVGMGQRTITLELSGDQDRVNGLIRMLKPFGIKSMCRTGRIALKRGDE